MNIKHKLTCAFAVIAGLPVALVILSLRDEAREHFLDSSSREIQQVAQLVAGLAASAQEDSRSLAVLSGELDLLVRRFRR